MNKFDFAMIASALYAAGDYSARYYDLKNPSYTPVMKCKEPKTLREYTWKGHTIMAYSKTDARNRIKTQLMKGERQ